MLSVDAKYTAPEADLFDQFDDEMEEGGRLPYLQVINAASKNPKVLDKDPLSFGVAINAENAEAAGLSKLAEHGWVEGQDISIHPLSTATIDHGFVGHSLNMVAIAVSDQEVQQKVNDQWRFVGLAYEGGKMTAVGAAAADEEGPDRQYRKVKRWLVLLLDDNLEPMHDRPLQLTAKGAFGATLSQEFNDFQAELGQAYRKAAKAQGRTVKGGRFTRSAQAFTVFPCRIGYHIPKENDRSAYTCLVERLQPVADTEKVGVKTTISRRDREVAVTGIHYTQVMINRNSPLGEVIVGLQAEFEDFAKPNRGRDADSPTDGSREYSGQGHIDTSTLDMLADGSVACTFDDGTAHHPLSIPEAWANRIGNGDAELMVDGVIPADGGPIQVTRVVVVENAAPVPVGAVPAGVSF